MMPAAKIMLVANTDWYLYNFRRTLALYLKSRGLDVVMVSPRGKYVPEFERLGLGWVQWEVGRQTILPGSEYAAMLNLEHIYRREKPDLVHHHTIKPVLYGSLAAERARVPAVVNSITGRGYIFLSSSLKARALRPGVRWFYRMAINRPNCAVIFENNVDRQYFIDQKLIPETQAFLVRGVGVDVDRFVPTPEPEGEPVAMMASRLLWDKGGGVFAEAAKIIHSRGLGRMVLVGSPDPGNPSSIPEQTIRDWEKQGFLEWWGWQSDMASTYARSHIVVLPSSYGEGVPTNLLEAASCARPIVATDIPGCREVVVEGENGYIVPLNDPAALADAIERLMRDPQLRQRMGAAGRQRVLQHFSAGIIHDETIKVYRSVSSIISL